MGKKRPIRVLLYSHDSQGLGHARRNVAIANHLARVIPERTGRDVSGLLVSGLPRASYFPLPAGFDWLTIPGISKGEDGYQARALGSDTEDLITLRSSVLDGALLGFAPDLTIIDRHVYGVRKELRRPLRHLRAAHPKARVVLGLREVLDAPEVVQKEWSSLGKTAKLRELVDQVWIYGDRQVHDPIATGEAPPALIDRIRFTGYLSYGRADRPVADELAAERPYILTTTGGGEDGLAILRAAVRMDVPAGHRHLVVAGPQLDETAYAEIEAAARPGTEVHRMLPGLVEHIENASAVVAMGGYNTVAEILATSTPALIVPREEPRTEQLIRAREMERVGAMQMLRTKHLNAGTLGAWVAGAVTRRTDRTHLELNGLDTTAQYAVDLLTGRSAATLQGATA